MLYIFHVDTGTMMTFDVKFAMQNLHVLKEEIEEQYQIPTNKQVFLISGGQMLSANSKICNYSAGTDTNPVYMFSKTIIESKEPPKTNCDYSLGAEFAELVDKCLMSPSNYNTITKYENLAQKFYNAARQHIHVCETLVHDQHLQQQGWAAVVANMDDVTKDFRLRAEDFEKKFAEQINNKNEYVGFLTRFTDDLDILASIPILPALRPNAVAHPFNAFDELDGKSESYEVEEDCKVDEEDDDDEGNIATTKEGSKGSSTSLNQSLKASDSDEMERSRSDRDLLTLHRKHASRSKEALTLLHWINIKENQESLKHIAEYCKKAMEIFDSSVMVNVRTEIRDTLIAAKKKNMKSIAGLEDRLSGLEQLMCEARNLVQEQKSLLNAFQNQQKAASYGDASTILVLCESLQQQLLTMRRNHQRLTDICRRCYKAKDELASNLYHRLKWIVYVENRMFETDGQLMFYHRSLARLKRHIAAVEQLHRAPSLYCMAVAEIVRRRVFSQAFLTWANELSSRLLTIYNEEVSRRRSFRSAFANHFLSDLFPGIDDMPPSFATQAPKTFDADLPKLTQSDIDQLIAKLPHLSSDIPTYDLSGIIQFFQIRSDNQDSNNEKRICDERLLAVKEATVDRGCESETDTEEFVKLGQSPIDRGGIQFTAAPSKVDAATNSEVRSNTRQPPIKPPRTRVTTPLPLAPIPEATSPQLECDCLLSPSLSSPTALSPRPPSPTSPTAAPGHRADFEPAEFYIEESPPVSLEWGCSASPLDSQTLVSLLQETIGSKKSEVDRLKEILATVSQLFFETIGRLRADLVNLKSDSNECRIKVDDHVDGLRKLEKFIIDNCTREREAFQRLTVDHELEMSDMKKILERKDSDITLLKLAHEAELTEVGNRVQELEMTVCNLNTKISEMEDVKQKDLKELQDKLNHEHKIEVESLRSRFRLVACTTSMDRSPSESSLEKIERTDMIEISNHKSILMQAKEDMELEKEEAVKRALEEQEKEWTIKINQEIDNVKRNYESEKQNTLRDMMKRIIEEKDRQLEKYQQRENQLYRECKKYKETIEQLTDPETSDMQYIQAKVCSLEEENRMLKEKCKRFDEKERQSKCKQRMPKGHSPIGLLPKSISISTCNIGEIVLVIWDGAHGNYTILQESPYLFLLHGDCLASLDLKLNVKDENERRLYAIGRVENKDHCVAVKTGNKYRVTVGQRFYRIKVRPLKSSENPLKDDSYCCSALYKETDSSQIKAVMRMTVSEAAGSYDNSSKSDKFSALTGSVYPVESFSLTENLPESKDTAVGSEGLSPTPGSSKSEGAASGVSPAECDPQKQSNLKFQPESVPYTNRGEVLATDCLSNEQISEIAEEATP